MLKLTSIMLMTALAATACSSSSDSPSDSTPPDGNDTGGSGTPGGDGDGTPDNGSSGDASISGNLTQLGFVSIDESTDDEEVSIAAFFYRFPQQVDSALFAGAIGGLNDQDFCSVSVDDDSDDTIPGLDADDLDDNFFESIQTLSAGEVITLASAAGDSYGEMQLGTLFGIQVYGTTVEWAYPAPAPLVVNIPGDEFPAFNNVQVPGADPLSDFTTSTGGSLTAASTISWTANSSGGAHVILEATNDNSDVYLDCILVDDGSYTLPAATVAELDAELGSGWSLEVDDAERTVYVVQQSGSSALVLTRTSE